MIPEWKRQRWEQKAQDWTYQTLIDQLEETFWLEVLLEEEIRRRDRKDVQKIREEALQR